MAGIAGELIAASKLYAVKVAGESELDQEIHVAWRVIN
jgi:hypothetical protein